MKSRSVGIAIFALTLAMNGCGSNPLSPKDHGYAAVSEGCCQSSPNTYGSTAFYYNGNQYTGDTGRGVNVAAVNLNTHKLIAPIQYFDTWYSSDEWPKLADFLNNLPSGTLVMFAVEDEAGLTWGAHGGCGGHGYSPQSPDGNYCCHLSDSPTVQAGISLLESYGATQIRNYCYRNSWSMIAIKGTGMKDESLTRSGPAKTSYIP